MGAASKKLRLATDGRYQSVKMVQSTKKTLNIRLEAEYNRRFFPCKTTADIYCSNTFLLPVGMRIRACGGFSVRSFLPF